ncbi:hypothetical protein EB001_08180 [bacterium]|jgi:hypothetical protein|nr:hypothetical protein [bacterium]
MSKRQILCILGFWVMIFLFLGVPSLWHKIIAGVSGLVIILISYNLPHEKKQNINDSTNI